MTTRSLTDGHAVALTPAELNALVEGAAWYVKYHNDSIPDPGADPSAAATARLEHFADLFTALDKLGIRLRRPAAVWDMQRSMSRSAG